MAENDIKIKISTDADTSGVDRAGSAIDGLGSKVGAFATGAVAALGVAAVAAVVKLGDAIVDFGKESFDAYQGSERAHNSLSSAIARTGEDSDKLTAAYEAEAAALEKKSFFEDEAIMAAQTTLVTEGFKKQSIDKLIPSIVDYAQYTKDATGKDIDLAGASKALAKTLGDAGKDAEGTNKALKQMGIELTDAELKTLELGTEEERVALVTGLMNEKFGGAAAEGGTELERRMDGLNDIMNTVKETIGKFINDALVAMWDWFQNKILPILKEVWEWFSANILPVLQQVAGVLRDQFMKAWEDLQKAIEPHREEFKQLAIILGVVLLSPILLVVGAIALFVAGLVLVATWIMNAIAWLIQLRDNYSHVMQVIGEAVGSFIAKAVEFFQNLPGRIMEAVGSLKDRVTGFFGDVRDAAVDRFQGILEWFGNLPSKIAAKLGGLGSAIGGAFKSAMNAAIDFINGAIQGINNATPGPIPDIPQIPKLARGTRFFEGGIATLGEEGIEQAILPRGTRIMSASETSRAGATGGLQVTNNIYTQVDMELMLRRIGQALRNGV